MTIQTPPTGDLTTLERSRGGGAIVTASELVAGDRLEFRGAAAGTYVFWPIIEINDTPKTRRLTIRTGQFSPPFDIRVRKTTRVARGLRAGEQTP